MIRILAAQEEEKAYRIAAETFAQMWEKVTGEKLCVIAEDDGESDLAVIGSDAVNDFTAKALADRVLESLSIRYGTDDYSLLSAEKDGRKFLFLSGGRGRSTLYAVYDYFERAAGCRYFWDGDVIPHRDALPLSGFSVTESPRFGYRGLRYFAHRGLWRFQAEHWSLSDWKREIDWIVKRRMNFFMLRIGMDDLFQRAFPDTVSYPNPAARLPEAKDEGYDDRTLFWPLEYRGILREKLQDYAQERDLMEPEDCGTMTHWYSRTPVEYLNKEKPEPLSQESSGYSEQTGLVWDPRVRRNLDQYLKLTETAVKEFGEPRLFHTIGLAERNIFADHRDNLNIKLFTYHRIMQEIFRRYPDAKLMLAGWDFLGWWKPEDVQRLIAELDPERTLILDYTNEGDDPEHCYLNWGIQGKIPWTFGIFHAFERQSSIRGPYFRIRERLGEARKDPMCRGLIFWPELSHSDTLMLEYLARNSWKPEQLEITELAESFSRDRYRSWAEPMNRAWQAALPLIQIFDWGGWCTRPKEDPLYAHYAYMWQRSGNFMSDMLGIRELRVFAPEMIRCWEYTLSRALPYQKNVRDVLETLASLPDEALADAFVKRDAVDLARSLVEQRIHHGLMRLTNEIYAWQQGAENADAIRARIRPLLEAACRHAEIIGCHDDYSMQATLEYLNTVCPVNPCFETALKHNLVNAYCRQAAYEPEKYLFLEEAQAYYDWVERNLAAGNRGEWKWDLDEKRRALYDAFMAKPLIEMRPPKENDLKAVLRSAAEAADQIRLD